MKITSKTLFWTNVAAFTVTGLLTAGIAFGWTNPSATPPSGSGAIAVDASGNVGIGTMSPTSKLQVSGKLKLVDGTQGVGKFLTSDASGLASWATLAKGAKFDHYDVYGYSDSDGISCTSGFTKANTRAGLSGGSRTLIGGHSAVYMATDGRWLMVNIYGDCSPESNENGAYILIPRDSAGAAMPGFWSFKGKP